MTEQKNKDVVRRAIEEIWHKGNMKVAEELTDPEYVGHMPGGQEIMGIDGIKDCIAKFRESFPNVHMRIESQVAEGDEVVTSMIVEGTQKGVLKTAPGKPDLQPTGKPISVRGMSRVRLRDGKVVEEWVTWDEQTAMESMGAPGLRPSYT